jgi:hypothetical protein
VGFIVNCATQEVRFLRFGLQLKDSQSAYVRHGYPWVPTDQAHGRPRQVGPAY